jgi:hypothetical protein
MDFGVHEDVVGVQLHVLNGLGLVDDGTLSQNGGVGHPRVDALNVKSSGCSAGDGSGVLFLNGQAQEEVSRSNEEDAILGFHFNLNDLLPTVDCIPVARRANDSIHRYPNSKCVFTPIDDAFQHHDGIYLSVGKDYTLGDQPPCLQDE